VDSFTGKPDQLVPDEYDFPAREEHNGQGRWVSPDPMRGTGNNVYADNNPLSKVDIYGMYTVSINGIDMSVDGAIEAAAFSIAESHPTFAFQIGSQATTTNSSGNDSSSSSTQTASGQQQAQAQASQTQGQQVLEAQNSAAATVAAAPTAMEEINAVVKPLIDSAVGAGEKAGMGFLDGALGVVGFIFASSQQTATEDKDTIHSSTDDKDSPEPEAAAGGAGASQGGGPITGFTKHGINQAISRDGVGVADRSILDAVKNPTQVVQQSDGRTMYVGKDATVIINAQGKVITTWANGSAGARIP
jgi:hypothetical protein